MPVIKSKKTTYEFDLTEIKTMIAEKLNENAHRVTVEYTMQDVSVDSIYGGPARYEVVGVKVTVDNT